MQDGTIGPLSEGSSNRWAYSIALRALHSPQTNAQHSWGAAGNECIFNMVNIQALQSSKSIPLVRHVFGCIAVHCSRLNVDEDLAPMHCCTALAGTPLTRNTPT